MRWIDFVKKYREDHPNLSYKKTLSAASEPFKKHKRRQKITEPKLKRRKSKTKDKEHDCGCHKIVKISVKKTLRDRVKKECGICEQRKHKVPPKTRTTKLMSGCSKRQVGKRAKRKTKQ
jgi:hypothetical protein